MPDLSEHIEEMLRLPSVQGLKLTDLEVAHEVIEIAYAQGLVTNEQANDKEYITSIANQVNYLRGN